MASVCRGQEIDTAIYQSDRPAYSVLGQVDNPRERQALSGILASADPAERLQRAEGFLGRFPASWHLGKVHELAARAAMETGDWRQALHHAQTSLELFPENALLLTPIAVLYESLGWSAQAARAARQALDALQRFTRPANISDAEWQSLEETLRAACREIVSKAEGEGPASHRPAELLLRGVGVSAKYAGSDACQACHPAQHQAWTNSGMAKMLRPYRPENVMGDFHVPEFRDESGVVVRLLLEDGRHFFELPDANGQPARMPVDYTIGSKWQQAYATRLPDGKIQVFPIQYNRIHRQWVNYWKTIDPPNSQRADIKSFLSTAEATNYQRNCAACHASQLRQSDIDAERLEDIAFKEPGVNCEMCHGPSGQHVEDFRAGTGRRNAPAEPPIDFRNISHRQYIRICGQCHMQSAMFFRGANGELNYTGDAQVFYQSLRSRPFNEFSKRAFYKDGRFRETTFIVESLLRSQCFERGGAHCGHCHDPHGDAAATNPKSLKFPDDPNEMCLQCHSGMREAPQKHTRHAAGSEGSRCASCHMPPIMHSLLFKAGTHKIDDIPQAGWVARFGNAESPNACLLCHADRDAGWVASNLVMWPKPGWPDGPRPEAVRLTQADQVRLRALASTINQAVSQDRFTVLVEGQNWDELARHARARLAESPQDAELHYWLGIALSQSDLVEAVRSFRRAEKLGLSTAALHTALGLTYYNLYQYSLFVEQMEKAIRLDPSDPDPYHYLGRYQESERNNFPEALRLFEKAIARDPNHTDSLYFRAYCLQMMGKREEARQGYQAAIARIENTPEANGWPYQKMAELLLDQDKAAALQHAKKAVEREPEVAEHRLVLGKVYESLGLLEEAAAERQVAAKLSPTDPSIHYQLARVYRKLGRVKETEEQLLLHQKLRAVYGAKE